MKRCVIDASVAVKWVVGEENAELAGRLAREAEELHAPAHWLAEAANTLWAKYFVRRQITQEEMQAGLMTLADAPVISTRLAGLLQPAVTIAVNLGVTVYDFLYLALAAELDLPFVTADHRLVSKTHGTDHAGRTIFVGDIA